MLTENFKLYVDWYEEIALNVNRLWKLRHTYSLFERFSCTNIVSHGPWHLTSFIVSHRINMSRGLLRCYYDKIAPGYA